jgi:hypothetical protein
MRGIAVFAALALLSSPALAQQTPAATGDPTAPAVTAPPSTVGVAPPVGSPLHPGTTVGLDKVGDDGISTKPVKAVPCSTAARETDGSTTCIGIPESGPGRFPR